MANTNGRNPNVTAELTHQSRRAAGKCPTADSLALRLSWYDKGQPKDPPDSSAGTSTRTKVKGRVNRTSPPELLLPGPVIQETNVDEDPQFPDMRTSTHPSLVAARLP